MNTRDRQRDQTHKAILDAIKTQDPDAAEQAMRAHLEAVLTTLHQLEKKKKRSSAG